MADVAWPVKTREVFNHFIDSRAWNGFPFRTDDIIIATYAKSGTTWMQQIISQLIFGGAEGEALHQLSPWVDLRILPQAQRAAIDHQTHRRFLKTHLPVDALVFSPRASYLYIARDGRDAAWSFHNHIYNATDDFFRMYNENMPEGHPVLERGTADPYAFYKTWLEGNGWPVWPFWEHIRSWWAVRTLPNVMLLHFNDLKSDLEGSIRRIAGFLGIAVDEEILPRIVSHCTFQYMKANATQVAPRGGATWKDGAATFINKGTNGRWRDRLTAADITSYEQRAVAELGPDCARWLSQGGPVTP
jgi:aryl sulfotransferase